MDPNVAGDTRTKAVATTVAGPRARWLAGAAIRFAAIVVLPFAVTALYLSALASDRYVSETRFAVRDSGTGGEPHVLDLSSLLGGGSGIALQDAYLIRDYILSLDLLAKLDAALELRAAWSDPAIDPIWRLAADASNEDFLDYYRDMVSVTFDTDSSIISVELQGFEAAATQRMLEMILAESERLVNEISHRLAREQLDFVIGEIDENTARLKAARGELLAF